MFPFLGPAWFSGDMGQAVFPRELLELRLTLQLHSLSLDSLSAISYGVSFQTHDPYCPAT